MLHFKHTFYGEINLVCYIINRIVIICFLPSYLLGLSRITPFVASLSTLLQGGRGCSIKILLALVICAWASADFLPAEGKIFQGGINILFAKKMPINILFWPSKGGKRLSCPPLRTHMYMRYFIYNFEHIRWEFVIFLEPILYFTVILGLFKCKFVICEHISLIPIFRI